MNRLTLAIRAQVPRLYLHTLLAMLACSGLLLPFAAVAQQAKQEQKAPLISNVTAEPKIFHQGDEIEFGFRVDQPAQVTLNVYDARGYLVWSKRNKKNLAAGEHKIIWNGKAKRNKLLIPEAYYYTISASNKAGQTSVYDLTDITGGERIYAQNTRFNTEEQKVTYVLPSNARFFLRYGIDQGPMLGTLINNAVQPFGRHSITWNGKDQSQLFELNKLGKIKFGISGYTLPRNALIYRGEKISEDNSNALINHGPTQWSELPADESTQRASKPDRTRNVHIHRFQNRESSKDFDISLISKSDNKTPRGFVIADQSTRFRVDIAAQDKPLIEAQRFEVSFFINNKLIHENEVSYVPYTWHLPDLDLPKGEHMLTALVIGFGNHFGVTSTKFTVQ